MIIAFFTIPRITILAPFGAYIAFWEAAGGRPKETGADGCGAAGGAEEAAGRERGRHGAGRRASADMAGNTWR
ncbi:MAG TPA: hypothetical protein H9734_03040, partial [Candidatus Fusicatenibacter merdavium]|nr:hypothetical protein [Candidatus Fusicatenibacter merdavium]